jgi:ATP-dependent helicase HrpA
VVRPVLNRASVAARPFSLGRRGPDREHFLEPALVPGGAAPAVALTGRASVNAPFPITYPPDLPVSERRDEIMAAIRDHQVVVVAGETGSGKTTQLPKMCLELGRGADGRIGHTQPRRIAARTVAERLAEELAVPLGGPVGYAVRFTDRVGPDTLVKVMTDGILLAEIRRDRLLKAYDTIIVDEAHERSLNIDFLLGYLTQLLPRRPDLKVVITSATIDTARFAAHFDAPAIEVSGRTWPVEMRYRPIGGDADPGADPDADVDLNSALCDAVAELMVAGPGDVLVFLPGERDIRDAAEALRTSGPPDIEILPLYARLSAAEQHKAFRPHRGRRVVLATNVAETSLTVPGIRFVIDTGLARISRFNHRTKVQRLPIERVSQASANQRAGRCGRLGPGVCIRLYSEDDFGGRPEYTDPEILRTNLASVILQMAAAGLGEIEDFPFLEPPDRRSVADGRALLDELRAFEAGEGPPRLTQIGRRLAELPLDPRLGRMVLEAEKRGCLREVTLITAAMAIQDPRERPADLTREAAEMHRRFEVPDSDFLSYVALWDYLAGLQAELSGNQFRKRLRAEFLHVMRVREWQDVVGQIRQVTRSHGVRGNQQPASAADIHQALLAGLLSYIGMRDRVAGDYRGARNSRWYVGRGSVLSRRPPAWAMAGELVETDRMWARSAARIDPGWAARSGAHLLKWTRSDPWWDAERGEAMVEEKATLYGLPVVAGRAVRLARMDPVEARQTFIAKALVERDWIRTIEPLEQTDARIEAVKVLETRARRRDLLAGDDVLQSFYDSRLPPQINGGASFERWWKQHGRTHADELVVPLDRLLDRRGGRIEPGSYPDTWTQGDLDLPLRYTFAPGSPDDGVSVEIGIDVLNRVEEEGFDWHVPGYRRELVEALIRSAPKEVRRALGPTREVAESILSEATTQDSPILDFVAGRMAARTGLPMSSGHWNRDVLPAHLTVAFDITDGKRRIGRGRDLGELRARFRGQMRAALRRAAPDLLRRGSRRWDFGDLPRVVERGRVKAYPTLVDEGDTVGVDIVESPGVQADCMWQATRLLLRLVAPVSARHLERRLTNETKLAVGRSGRSIEALIEECATAVADQIIIAHGGPAFTQSGFETMAEAARHELPERVARVATIAGGVLAAAQLVTDGANALERRAPEAWTGRAAREVRDHIAALTRPGFVTDTGSGRLRDVLRYLDAAGRRLQLLPGDARRDRERQSVVDEVDSRYRGLVDRAVQGRMPGGSGAALAEIRWMIEELRVSLWAQELGTSGPVSQVRIVRAIERLGG